MAAEERRKQKEQIKILKQQVSPRAVRVRLRVLFAAFNVRSPHVGPPQRLFVGFIDGRPFRSAAALLFPFVKLVISFSPSLNSRRAGAKWFLSQGVFIASQMCAQY